MKSYRVRVTVAVGMAVAGLALSACGPVQAGAAAIVGGERISSSDVDAKVREFRADLASHKIPEEQLNLGMSVSQLILYNTANARQYAELARRKGVTVTESEIDGFVTQNGGQAKMDEMLLSSGIPLSMGRDTLRTVLIQQKLMMQAGAGNDQQSRQAAMIKVGQEADAAVPVSFSPRYGKFDPQQGFVADDRLGAVPSE
ncbi:SurA N-terminal domain-containing protein [Microtetraspora sp. NBRC 16547]|uniref:SurA N-terminal domain-containing protein n=1 Tax=Microtetraspora sp. NBRC 16547 TaxID=3030993 RepID=UPI0024A34573|nr:SurA N-terminal domain-containing protein [Microtetraspora sp. NBRC 16547]GLW97585.1 hypothetical protein Misp02_16720 [Microtetraspora sp. NBRC 16547]